jgi:hypothetical protein
MPRTLFDGTGANPSPIDFHEHRVEDHRRTGRELATTMFDDSAIPPFDPFPPSFVGHSDHLTFTDLPADHPHGQGGSPKRPKAADAVTMCSIIEEL